MTISQHIVLIGVTVSELSAPSEDAKKKIIFFKDGTKFATMDFKLRPISKGKETEPKGKK